MRVWGRVGRPRVGACERQALRSTTWDSKAGRGLRCSVCGACGDVCVGKGGACGMRHAACLQAPSRPPSDGHGNGPGGLRTIARCGRACHVLPWPGLRRVSHVSDPGVVARGGGRTGSAVARGRAMRLLRGASGLPPCLRSVVEAPLSGSASGRAQRPAPGRAGACMSRASSASVAAAQRAPSVERRASSGGRRASGATSQCLPCGALRCVAVRCGVGAGNGPRGEGGSGEGVPRAPALALWYDIGGESVSGAIRPCVGACAFGLPPGQVRPAGPRGTARPTLLERGVAHATALLPPAARSQNDEHDRLRCGQARADDEVPGKLRLTPAPTPTPARTQRCADREHTWVH